MSLLAPTSRLGPRERRRGLRYVTLDGVCTQAMTALTSGAFLVAFALALGASNVVVGALAAVGPLTQILQIPAVHLVERLRARRRMVVVAATASRLCWLPVVLLPLAPEGTRLPIFLASLGAYFALGSVSGCAWGSWMRDLVPDRIRGRFFARRLAVALSVGAAVALAGGFVVERAQARGASPLEVYPWLFGAGAVAGLAGVLCLARTPEPRMAPSRAVSVSALLAEPFRDGNFRQLLLYLGAWNFAVNLAAPFFVVYMLKRLGVGMGLVLVLSVTSQLVNVAFLPLWGRLADRFSNKSVLGAAGPLFVLSIAVWPFTTLPERHFLTVPLLFAIHVLAGVSTSGVTLCAANIGAELAPRGRATAFLGAEALVNGLAASVAPLLAGLMADFFGDKSVSVLVRMVSADAPFELDALDLRGLDFVFGLSVLLGLYACHRLLSVREEGEVPDDVVLSELYLEVRRRVRHVSNVAGLGRLTAFPWERLVRVSRRR